MNKKREKQQQLDGLATSDGLDSADEGEATGGERSCRAVSDMFDGQSVFITGASGFIGRVLLEKLLRTYEGIRKIYVLMRSKKDVTPEERLERHLLRAEIFAQLRATRPQVFEKIVVVPGDIGQVNLGLEAAWAERLLSDESLSVVFHSAATVKFDEPLLKAVKDNLLATQSVVALCRQLGRRLRSFCHVSTAYVNSHLRDDRWIEEKLYPMDDDPEQLIRLAELLDVDTMQELKHKFLGRRPNTYTYTKALAEHLIARTAADLPVAIVRPSIVVAAWAEPLAGWIDNLNGPTGLILAINKGLLRTLCVDTRIKADVIPVDITVNAIVAAAYCAMLARRPSAAPTRRAPAAPSESDDRQSSTTGSMRSTSTSSYNNNTSPLIVHCNSGELNPITWGRMESLFFPVIRRYPSAEVFRYPFGTFKRTRCHDLFARLFAHLLPALIIDLVCALLGRKRRMLQIYGKLHSAAAALDHFTNQNYNFRSDNLRLLRDSIGAQDRQSLCMDVERIDWFDFWHSYVLGCRRHVLNESDDTLEESRRSLRRYYYVEMLLRTLMILMTLVCLRPLAVSVATCRPVLAIAQVVGRVLPSIHSED